ncbi:MAG: nitroreductase family protein [Clostridia bacterium]|nr:nitroreductase family protein [Clostridia bacterium]
MIPIRINESQCIGCGLCVSDCPNACLYLEGSRARAAQTGCIACGHCYAICPSGAIRMEDYDAVEEPVVSMAELSSDTLLSAMKSRRTIRRFTRAPVEPEKLAKILEAGRYSPTGGNAQNVAYTVLGGKQAEAEAICVRLFRTGKKLGAPFIDFLKRVEIGDDFFFKGAPLVVVVSGKSDINAGLASAYMELMAESLGLGVLYSGFFVICAKISRKLRKLLDLPKGHKVVSCMIFGYPAVKYRRIVPRKPLQARRL